MEARGLDAVVFGYAVERRLLGDEVCRLIFDYVNLRHTIGRLMPADGQVLSAPTLYGDPLTDALMQQRLPIVEETVGCRLWPTYSYLRLHGNGAELPLHQDRKACEISVSINVGGDAPWPLWLRAGTGDVAVELEVGDALIYEGAAIPHWRAPFRGTLQIQCLLHYVRREGPFASEKYDGRPALGTPFIPARVRIAARGVRGGVQGR